MRWQPWAVAAGLAAPPVVLAVAVWPSAVAPAGFGEPEAELVAGDREGATTDGLSSADFLVLGPGVLRIDVDGPGFDPTLTLVDPDTGDQLDYNDDSDGLNPSLTVELGDGESVRAQVRSLGGPPGGRFTISVTAVGGDEPVAPAEGGGVAPTTAVLGGAFEAPIGDEPVVVEAAGVTITLRQDGSGVCLDVETGNSGSGTCAPSLRDLAQPGGFGGSFDGRQSLVDVVTLVGPEVASAVVVLLDESEIELPVVALPGRAEQVVVGQVRLPGNVFEQPVRGAGVLVLRDSSGSVLDSLELT